MIELTEFTPHRAVLTRSRAKDFRTRASLIFDFVLISTAAIWGVYLSLHVLLDTESFVLAGLIVLPAIILFVFLHNDTSQVIFDATDQSVSLIHTRRGAQTRRWSSQLDTVIALEAHQDEPGSTTAVLSLTLQSGRVRERKRLIYDTASEDLHYAAGKLSAWLDYYQRNA